jgi:hypothetical protein
LAKTRIKGKIPYTLIGVARVVVVLVLERAFVVGGEVVAATTGPAEMRCQPGSGRAAG